MTDHEIELARAIADCAGVTAHARRFVRDVCAQYEIDRQREITLRQRHYLEILAWRYRRQLAAHLTPDAKPRNLPKRKPAPKPPAPHPPPDPQMELFR